MDELLAAITAGRDVALDFLGLTTTVINVQVTMVVPSGVPPVTP